VRAETSAGVDTDTATIDVFSSTPTLSVTLAANPDGGTAPLAGADLVADVDGTAGGPIRYLFDCTDDGIFEADVTTGNDPYTAVDLCSYPSAGTYTARVTVERQGVSATATTIITVDPAPIFSVVLTAVPSSGVAPLTGVDLKANVSGATVGGKVRYRFDCTDDGTFEVDVTKKTSSTDPSYTAVDSCSYSVPGVYTARVIVDQNGLSANNTATITVDPVP